MRRFQLVFALLLILATPALAQQNDFPTDTCGSKEPLQDCYARFATQTMQATAQAAAVTKQQAERRVTSATLPGGASAVTDLLPSFLAAGGLQGIDETDDVYTLAKIFDVGELGRLELRGDLFHEADLFEPLREKLPDDLDEGILEELQDAVGSFDKVDVQVAFGWERPIGNRRFGRDPNDYSDITWDLLTDLYTKILGIDETPIEAWQFSDEVTRFDASFDIPKLLTRSREDLEGLDVPVAEVDTFVSGLVRAATGMRNLQISTGESMNQFATELSELVTNQPQLLVEGIYSERDQLTGPSEWSTRICYEMGLSGNLNDFLSWSRKPGNNCSEADYDCYRRWKGSDRILGSEDKAVDRGHRLTFALGYTETDPLRFDLAAQGVPTSDFSFSLDRTQKWTGSLTYGINLDGVQLPNLLGLMKPSVLPVDTARFDLEAKYDDVTGDPMRQSRLTATATLSQKMSDKSIFSIGVAWAEKPEYLGEVDEELSANLGLRWSFYGPDDSKKKRGGDSSNAGDENNDS